MYCVLSPVRRLRLLLISAAVLMGSCAPQQIQLQADGFNRAIEYTTNEMLLLNVVRASKDLPVYFTKLTGYSGGNMLSGNFQPRFPFGPKAVAAYDIGLSATWSSGVGSMQFADLNQFEGLAGLNRRVEFHVFHQYANNNYPWWVLATVMMQRVDITQTINQAIVDKEREFCSQEPESKLCRYTAYIKSRCQSWVAHSHTPFVGKDLATVAHINDGTSECGYLRFQAFVALLAISGFYVETVPYSEAPPPAKAARKGGKKGGKGKESEEAEAAPQPRFVTDVRFVRNPRAEAALQTANKLLSKSGRAAWSPTMRSPKRMIEFLGELTASQNYAKQTFIPRTLVYQTPVTFFRVVQGEKALRDAAVSVQSPQGEVFSVPQPELGSPTRDQSLIVLSIVNDLVNQATSKEAYPTPGIVEIRTLN